MSGVAATATTLDAAGQMAFDEAILFGAPRDVVVFRVFEWSGQACTFGYSQPYQTARAACEQRGWTGVEPIRRATGGGIVFHGDDVTFSLVFPWQRTAAPEEIYKRIHRGIHVALKTRGAATGLWSPPARVTGISANCFARAEPMDLVRPDGLKILGGALRKRDGKGLYQGSFHPEGLSVDRAVAIEAVAEGAAREFGAAAVSSPRDEWAAIGKQLEMRYRSAEWNQRR